MALSREEILENYHTPGHPTAFAGVSKVVEYYNGRASQEFITKVLESSNVYTRHREYKQPKYYNPYYVYRQREQVQADLIDVQDLARHNDNVRYLLLFIDLFSRKVWVVPLDNKSSSSTRDGIRTWLDSLGTRKCEIFATDSGREFKNSLVAALLQSRDITQQFKSGTSKACFAERANKSLQTLIYKYLTHNQTFRYIDKLDSIVNTYNHRPHRSLDNVSPHEADKPRCQAWIRSILQRNHTERREKAKKEPKFSLGDTVRIKILPKKISRESRAYVPQFKGEYFTVIGIKTNMMVPMYRIRSQDTNEIIQDNFYAEELQRVRGNIYQVERVLARRGRGANREIFVKWMFFGPQHNSWVKVSDVTNTYQ